MRIRLAARDDVQAILEISNWAAEQTPANFATAPEPLEEWLATYDRTHESYPWLVAREDEAGAIVGFAKAGPHRARGAYAWTAEVSVYIHPDRHRQGIGRALYERLIPMLRAQGYVTLLAGITTPNPASEKLHESFGFRRCATFSRAGWKLGRWHDVGYWELALDEGSGGPGGIRAVRDVFRTNAK